MLGCKKNNKPVFGNNKVQGTQPPLGEVTDLGSQNIPAPFMALKIPEQHTRKWLHLAPENSWHSDT